MSDDVIRVSGGHGGTPVSRGRSPIVRDIATARLTSSAAQAGDYYDDAWEV